MSDDADRWKDRYLQALEQQERQEERWRARLDLLRRGLVRSSLAVEGADLAVDRCMAELREVLREDDDLDQGLTLLVPRLEKAVLDSEQRRQQRQRDTVAALEGLAAQLQALPVPAEVRKGLKRFARTLPARVAQSRELPALLGELSRLQGQALALQQDDDGDRGGLLARLFGARGRNPDQPGETIAGEPPRNAAARASQAAVEALESALETQADDEAEAQPLAASTPVQPVAAVEAALPTEPAPPGFCAPIAGDAVEECPDDDPGYALPASPQPGYSAIAERVESTLRQLLDELPLPAPHQPRAEALRERIRNGLNWYELVPLLDDLALLMLTVADIGQREFGSYLRQLDERLSAMQASLTVAREGHVGNQAAADALEAELREQVGGLQSSLRQAPDLHSLKQTVEARLEGLLQTVDTHRQQRSARELALDEQLQQLSARLHSAEQHASELRQEVEEQRSKALHDALTGLPNRAAWDDRLAVEVARRQRHGGPLLLALLDLDHFKRINDGYGHLAGDRVLKIVASELGRRIRPNDFLARLGGEEFALLITETALEDAEALLEALRQAIEACPFHFKGERVQVSFSAGLSAFAGQDEDAEAVLERADQALYRAKQAGRNRIELG
ncbi:GGDEF domain-containing protein [Stutzerimonas azotifigens]|uniref:GGDEF domain-containing protein n=1 Tax=Stutzerimonas azotifigens TaxID=291995 RepID=UPI000409835C|nr:GGDEF domain-containing protein [Stutzerimonas azotifigens]